jgi:hypothetical protein
MDPAERALLEATVRDVLGRAGANGPQAVDDALAELGWLEMLDAEPRDAIDIVCTALGAANGTASVLDDIVGSALGVKPDPEVAVLLPGFATWEPPARGDGELVSGVGLGGPRAATAREVLVVCRTGTESRVVTVPASSAQVGALHGIDPAAGFHRMRVQHPAQTGAPLDADAWDAAVAVGRRAVAHQIVGATRAMLGLARAHALERVQFGRPIAQFQAVRHRLAETLVAIEALEAALTVAADEPNTTTAALAKALAGRTARTVAGNCQQVLAGIGFTTDHPFHGHLKRTMLLEGVFGSADEIVVALGRQLLATRTVPTLVEL